MKSDLQKYYENNVKLYSLIKKWLFEYLPKQRNFSHHTIRSYKKCLNEIREYMLEKKQIPFSKLSLDDFTRKTIYDFLLFLKDEQGNSVSTVNQRLAGLKSFLKFCLEEDASEGRAYAEIASIHSFRETKTPAIAYLEPEQLRKLLLIPDATTLLGRRDQFLMILLFESGARKQEVLDLQLKDIIRNGDNVMVRLHGKSKKIRFVPLLGDTVLHLDRYIEEFHSDENKDDFLFYTIHDDKHTQMKPSTADHILKKYGMLANRVDSMIPTNLHAHMFRHSIAMTMYKKGIPISYIRDFLGHSSIETTSIYAHADVETLKNSLEQAALLSLPKNSGFEDKKWKINETLLLKLCGLK